MQRSKTTLYASLKNDATREVRHLLIDIVDTARETNLIQLSAGFETFLSKGTEHESRQNGDELIKLWTSVEGFKWRKPYRSTYEPLQGIIALAVRLGFSTVYDPRKARLTPSAMNPTGEVSLLTWPGLSPRNGGGYEYAFDGMAICARPTLPPTVDNVAPSDPKKMVAFILRTRELLDSVGPEQEFTLGGDVL